MLRFETHTHICLRMCECSACIMYVHTCTLGARGGQEKALAPLELVFQTAMSHCAGT